MALLSSKDITFNYSPNPSGNLSLVDGPDSIAGGPPAIRRLAADTKKAFDGVETLLTPLTKDLTPNSLVSGGTDNQVLSRLGTRLVWKDPTTISVLNTWCGVDLDIQYPVGAYVDSENFPQATFRAGSGGTGNDQPYGICSDGVYMYTTDLQDKKIFAYDLRGKNHVPAREFNTLDAAGNDNPRGCTTDGSTMWVADTTDQQIYAYDMGTFVRLPASDFTKAKLNGAGITNLAGGIHVQDGIMFIMDATDDIVYAFDAGGGQQRLEPEEFSAANIRRGIGNNAPRDIWMDEKYLYVLSNTVNTAIRSSAPFSIFIFDRESKLFTFRTIPLEIYIGGTTGPNNPYGIWSDGEYMFVLDLADDQIYAVSLHGVLRETIGFNGANISSVQKLDNRQLQFSFRNNLSTNYTVFTTSRITRRSNSNLTLQYNENASSVMFGIL